MAGIPGRRRRRATFAPVTRDDARGLETRPTLSTAARHPASIEVVTLLRKPDAVKVHVPVKYVGFDIPNDFVVGYGLDYAERYRDLPYIGRLKPAVYAS